MIPALLVLFFMFTGGGYAPFADLVKQFKSGAKDAIAATDRRDAAQAVLKQMSGAIKDHEKSRSKSIKALTTLGDEDTPTAADIRAIFDARYDGDAAFQEKIITLYAELKTHVTAEEWAIMTAGKK